MTGSAGLGGLHRPGQSRQRLSGYTAQWLNDVAAQPLDSQAANFSNHLALQLSAGPAVCGSAG
jgi:hypothetical protein